MKLLFGVFDWGIGHATRCIPLIEALKTGHEVHVLSTGQALALLRSHFSESLRYFDVPSLTNMYAVPRQSAARFILSAPLLYRSLEKARALSGRIVREGRYDIIVSDCRFDVFDRPENSFLINHQLRLMTPPGFGRLSENILHRLMCRYGTVIVPDFPEKNLTGRLSRDLRYMPHDKIRYIGILSQLKKRECVQDIDRFISLSGPEATRRALQKKIVSQAAPLEGKTVIAGGVMGGGEQNLSENITFCSFQDRQAQESLMNRARYIIIRAGYTTIMELAELGKRALLIPSPGQTEQEYLCRRLKEQGYFNWVSQSGLDLSAFSESMSEFRGFKAPWKTEESVWRFLEAAGLK